MSPDPEPGISYRFLLEIDGYDLGSFAKVEGIAATYDVTSVKEGGENTYVHSLPGRVSYTNVTLTRAIDQTSAQLASWFTEFQVALSSSGRMKPTSASISALASTQVTVTTWNFAHVVPVKYVGPSFDASSPGLAVEKLEFAHHGFWSGASAPSAVGT